MSSQIKKKVSRFISKSSNLKWPEGIVDFDNQSFVVNGVKPLVEVQDEIETAFVWCWSIKDSLIKNLVNENPNINKQTIEDEINKYKCLTYCSDIANGLKHGGLNNSRSGDYAKLSVVQSISISGDLISVIHRIDGKYFIVPKSADCVKIKAYINDDHGRFLLDAYTCLHESLIAWDKIANAYT